jgi:hypothetical protein
MMQLSGLLPHEIGARVHAAYDAGVLERGVDPDFPDTVAGLVQAINHLVSTRAPNVVFGWQFNLWASASPGSSVPGNGLVHWTDTLGIAAGRARIVAEAERIADYYLAAGVMSRGADFVSVDKYGLDGGFGGGAAAPWDSLWFWNAVHWNNYLVFAGALAERTAAPVVLWQLPVGHVNHSLAVDPRSGGLFPALTNTFQRYEDSAPTYFLGDSFSTGADAARRDYFGEPDPEFPASVRVDGHRVTWRSHMEQARDAGVIAILFGDGVGESTRGRGAPPPDGHWFLTKAQDYLADPVSLAPP